jgi:hypothetical protein
VPSSGAHLSTAKQKEDQVMMSMNLKSILAQIQNKQENLKKIHSGAPQFNKNRQLCLA